VDEATRKSLFKLRSTWDEIFPLKKLYALDVRVNSIDPAWPIKPLPPNVNASIHVNPKFLKPVSIRGVLTDPLISKGWEDIYCYGLSEMYVFLFA